jgi:hypothetical protein
VEFLGGISFNDATQKMESEMYTTMKEVARKLRRAISLAGLAVMLNMPAAHIRPSMLKTTKLP